MSTDENNEGREGKRVMSMKELGKVVNVELSRESHGILTLNLMLDFGGSFQNFGGLSLCDWSETDKRRVGTPGGLDFILQILDLFEVNSLEKIKGRTVYALRASEVRHTTIIGLETPPFDGGRRFFVGDWMKRWELS